MLTDRTIDELKYADTFLRWDIRNSGHTKWYAEGYWGWCIGTWTICESLLFQVPALLYWSVIAHSEGEFLPDHIELTQTGNFPLSGSLPAYFAELHAALTMFHEATRNVYARKEAMEGLLGFDNLDDYINRALQREARITIAMEAILVMAYEKLIGQVGGRLTDAATPLQFLENNIGHDPNPQVVEFLKEVQKLIAGQGQFDSWARDLYNYVDVVSRLMKDIDQELETAGIQVIL